MTGLRASWSLRDATPLARSRARIAETESRLRAWVALDFPSSGRIPLGVKDIIDVAGFPTRCGSPLRADAAPALSDAAIVTAWRAAGAVPVGKTVTTEFAYFSPGPTDNPSAPGHTPGGSSSGSAAAVAAGQVPLALGSQTAGSVTRPASYCGVASLVMSHGRFPMDGVTGLSPSLDSHGVFAAGVSDLALAFSLLTGSPATAAARPPRLLRWRPPVEPSMAAAIGFAAARLAAAGAAIDEFPASVAELTAAHPVVMAYEAARERAAELAQIARLSVPLATLLRAGLETPEASYAAALRAIRDARDRIAPLLEPYDAILGPAALGPPPAGRHATGDPVLSRPWQALGLPVVTVPGLSTSEGLPLGVQLVGRRGGETALLATGCWVESALQAPQCGVGCV
ncbi:amidase [Amycolatopsis sp. MtRt-6]|uniref:amidase family protein n=1 Tax=Amycolatopsis sp. MtRt-6 TaxID=2792782 RepID=UPI001F5DAAF4|nr:amidase [Amycolatopsis sp. MtRt-6]